MMSLSTKAIRLITIIAFVIMIIANALANILPINGLNTGQISNSYPNLFAPASITFSIWVIIYILLGIYSIYQIYALKNSETDEDFLNEIDFYFIISSLANALWIIAWHYLIIWLSLIHMLLILVCLININTLIQKKSLDQKVSKVISLPFGIYFGWITVATIANVTTFLVSINWNGFGIPDYIWTIVVLITGLIIGSVTTYKIKNLFYNLVFIWAYTGILIKHIQKSGFGANYLSVIVTLLISLFIFVYIEYDLYVKLSK